MNPEYTNKDMGTRAGRCVTLVPLYFNIWGLINVEDPPALVLGGVDPRDHHVQPCVTV